MAKYTYRVLVTCLRTDLQDLYGPGGKRLNEGELVESPREIDSPKFELVDYQPDPPSKAKRSKASAEKEE